MELFFAEGKARQKKREWKADKLPKIKYQFRLSSINSYFCKKFEE